MEIFNEFLWICSLRRVSSYSKYGQVKKENRGGLKFQRFSAHLGFFLFEVGN